VDELTFAARRAVASLPKATDGPDLETRFRNLVQSPLRAGLLRFLSARPEENFDVEVLMSTFGRLRLDVENCLNELVAFGVARRRSLTTSSSGALRSAWKTAHRRCSASAR
jgi:hypothetical protein